MSQLHTFYRKISKKGIGGDNMGRNNTKNDGAVGEATLAAEPQVDTEHSRRPKLLKYVNAKQYFERLRQVEQGAPVKPTAGSQNKLWPLFDDEAKDQKVSSVLWSWIEKPFLSLVLPKKNVWWVMGEKNEYFPSITEAPFGSQNIMLPYLIHLIIWAPIFYIYFNHPICGAATRKPIIFGFLFGLLCFILIDVLNNNNTDLLVDKARMEWNISHSEKQADNMTVIKAGQKQIFGKRGKTHGLIYKPEKFSRFAVEQNLQLLPLKDWYTNYWKESAGSSSKADEVKQAELAKAHDSISSAGYYLISNIVTVGIVTARANLKYFRFITPLVLLISIIAICGIYNWVWTYHASQSYNILNTKRKILIESIAISITCCLLVINCKFFQHHDYSYDKIFL